MEYGIHKARENQYCPVLNFTSRGFNIARPRAIGAASVIFTMNSRVRYLPHITWINQCSFWTSEGI